MIVNVSFESSRFKDFCKGHATIQICQDKLETGQQQNAYVDIVYTGTFSLPFSMKGLPISVQIKDGEVIVHPLCNFFSPLSMCLAASGFNLKMSRSSRENEYTGFYKVHCPPDDGTVIAYCTATT